MLSPKLQELLEKICTFYGTEEEAREDPEFCLEVMLEEIAKDLERFSDGRKASAPILTSTLHVIEKGAIKWRREKQQKAA